MPPHPAFNFAPASANDNETMTAFLLTMRGHAAALCGQGLATNPYWPDSQEGALWAAGWSAGIVEIGAHPLEMHRPAKPGNTRLHAVGVEPLVG